MKLRISQNLILAGRKSFFRLRHYLNFRRHRIHFTYTSSHKDYVANICKMTTPMIQNIIQCNTNSFLDIPDIIRSTSHSIQSKKEKSAQLPYLLHKNMSKNGVKNLKLRYFTFNLNFISKINICSKSGLSYKVSIPNIRFFIWNI